jgi:hypothetical protein
VGHELETLYQHLRRELRANQVAADFRSLRVAGNRAEGPRADRGTGLHGKAAADIARLERRLAEVLL